MTPKAWREARKLSLREAADLLGVPHMSIARYETGEREAPASVVDAYQRASKRAVTLADFTRTRQRYLREHDKHAA